MTAWLSLIKERFHPALYIPTVFLFTWFNVIVFTRRSASDTPWSLMLFLFVPVLLFFFRLRLFDEIKDYETDLKINPTRPLARGILSVSQVKVMLLLLIAVELIWVYKISPLGFFFYIAAVMYSLMMYEEFFVGDFLRPHLTTYAITHTWVCGLLSLAIGVAALSVFKTFGSARSDVLEQLFGKSLNLALFEKKFWLIAGMNWFYFNFFEFARKTFSKEEEKATVPSYSKIFTPFGAALLSFSQILLALGCWLWWRHLGDVEELPWLSFVVALASLALCWVYIQGKNKKSAELYRTGCGLILLIQYVVLIFEQGRF
jgi:4-hydroxybenzoate polyprenyltransferase